MPSFVEHARDTIIIRGARQNNLKGINLDLELNKFHVITGPSGSGKSSLAFDTIYAEGQRRYVETFSPYTRQFLERMDKPLVDEILGIPPAIAIEQANRVRTTRSTVGTMTEINDYLKLLMPRVARAFCPECQREIVRETPISIAATLLNKLSPRAVLVTFGVPAPPGTDPGDFFSFLNQQGFLRIWLNQEMIRTDIAPAIKRLPGLVFVIQDRLTMGEANHSRLVEAIEQGLNYGKGQLKIVALNPVEEHRFSIGWHCPYCDIEIRPPAPGLFSFNNPLGACPGCRGFGRTIGIDLDRAMPNRSLSIADGVVKPFQTGQMRECQQDLISRALERQIDIHCAFEDLPKADQEWVINGDLRPDLTAEEVWQSGGWYGIRGFFDWMESRAYKMHVRVFLSRYRAYTLCPQCQGSRFKPETLHFRVVIDTQRLTLPDLQQISVEKLAGLMKQLRIAESDSATEVVRSQIVSRLEYLIDVGLGYLALDRPTRSLSGGEVQRVNLTTCLGASLVNTLFVLDEPSVGLHPRDVHRLIGVLRGLRDKGNTLLVVEHEEAVIRSADNLIEIGPGRGELGGELVYQGPIDEIGDAAPESLTAAYLTRRKRILPPAQRRKPKRYLEIFGAREHNLKNIDVRFPLHTLCCVTGVSGSGKSTLVQDVLYQNLIRLKGGSSEETPGICDRVLGVHDIDEIILVDQSPLARSPRSTPALYIGVFDRVRELFAGMPESRAAGLTPAAFSFNSGIGRCERCAGLGYEKVEMQFLSDQYIRCGECDGKRYQPHLLNIKMRGKSIHDVLELTVTEAIAFFRPDGGREAFTEPLELLKQVGLGYLRLGQPVNVLSGGESQRLKLVGHLAESKKNRRHALLIFDEPTTGLHFDDIASLLKLFQQLVDRGDTLIVIEHNMDIIQSADYIIDLGPEAGVNGGRIVAEGTPEQVAKQPRSQTGNFLREKLATREPRLSARVAEIPRKILKPVITVQGGRHHNLKNLSLELPHEKLVVITGLSGSGKSSLAFDILFAEGQRRFLDSMSTYARQFVEQLERPDVDHVEGIPPTVAIEQRLTQGGGKSTVATLTEVYHFLRLLFAKLGTQYCPRCNIPVSKQSGAAILRQVRDIVAKTRATLTAPLVKARKGYHKEVAIWIKREGYEELIVDGKRYGVDQFPSLERYREHTIEVVIAELRNPENKQMHQLVKTALQVGNGSAFLWTPKPQPNRASHHSLGNNGASPVPAFDRFVLSSEMTCPNCGDSFEELDPRLFSFNSPHGWCPTCKGYGYILPFTSDDDEKAESRLAAELMAERRSDSVDVESVEQCPECRGARLNATALAVQLQGHTIDQITGTAIKHTISLIENLRFSGVNRSIASDIVAEIKQRLLFMRQVGLEYLTLNRPAKTLSGGESQRIRLAAQLGSNLRGVLYVLDEPTIGLHPRDNERLLDTLEALKMKGNTLVVVEHDEGTMRRSDLIVDLGPGAGRSGGNLVFLGPIREIVKRENSVTGKYLAHPLAHPVRGSWRPLQGVDWLAIRGAHANNLKNIDIRFPIGRLSVITGVSGSGKSTILRSVLLPAVAAHLQRTRKKSETYPWNEVAGVEHLGAVFEVDQSPIGKTSRSIPATYVKIFDDIRALFAQLPESRIRGYSRSRFSFNTEGGRCETCTGQGVIKLEMNFLPPSYIPCEACQGKRFNSQTLAVQYNGKSIGDLLELTIEEAAEFFRSQPRIHKALELLVETGLGYLQLGQPSPTLSGGEAQRLKIVSELKTGVGRGLTDRLRRNITPKSTLYLLEEPTIGLHMADVELLIEVLHRLVDDGNTVILIEHNLDIIAEADYILDVGPEAGDDGGEVVAAGSVEELARHEGSRTAPFICKLLSLRAESSPANRREGPI
ncbi:MAG: excinuclease ABC subunit UvrA [Verrucomicrobia bacterium]|nr:excinuclease ABC subunit UvrA [Verrucomicrobiota bacterium]